MTNTPVPAAAEGVPNEIHARNRIRDLAYEISLLLDRVPLAAMLTINPAGSKNHPVFLCEYTDEDRAVSQKVSIPDDPSRAAEYHARKLAGVMADWPDCMRFQVTVKPHDAEQRLFWESLPDEATEVDQVKACIEQWRSANKAYAKVCDTEDEVSNAAGDAEDETWNTLLQFPCRTGKAKELKIDFIISTMRKLFEPRLDSHQLETLLSSVVQ